VAGDDTRIPSPRHRQSWALAEHRTGKMRLVCRPAWF
jgi:hypothetical protein